MTAKTRYFLIGSVMVLIVGLSIGLVAFYGGVPSGLFSRDHALTVRYLTRMIVLTMSQCLLRGRVRVALLGSEGEEFILSELKAGDFFGEVSLAVCASFECQGANGP